MLARGDRLYVYPFRDYWVDVGTVQAYWQASMDLLLPDPPLRLAGPSWPTQTRNQAHPPADVYPGAVVSNSFISDGCVVEGRVENSILSPGVRVKPGAIVRNSVIWSDGEIGSKAVVDRAILDENVIVGDGARIGLDPKVSNNGRQPDSIPTGGCALAQGLALVGQNTRLPADLCVGRGYSIGCDLKESDFGTELIVRERHVDRQPAYRVSSARQRALVSV